jgi:hypothetical protein
MQVSSADSRDTHEVKTSLLLWPLYNSLLQSYATVSIHIQSWNQICFSTLYFNWIFSIHQHWSMAHSQSTVDNLLCVIPTAGLLFFPKGLNRGFYIPAHVYQYIGGC